MANKVIRLVTFQTRLLFDLEDYAPGTYDLDLLIEGNSLLSTLYVKSTSGGSVKVNYYEETTGELFGERKDLPGHPIQSVSSNDPSKITVTPFHNKPKVEVIVSGGNVEFSLYVTVVSTFASDLDAALQFDGEVFVPATDKGLPAMCVDEGTGLLNFLRCDENGLKVSGILTGANTGDPFFEDGSATPTTPGTDETLTSFTVPVGTTRNLTQVWVSSNHPGVWTLDSGGSIIASGRIQPGHPDSYFRFVPTRPIAASTLIKLNYCARSGRDASDVNWHIMANDFT